MTAADPIAGLTEAQRQAAVHLGGPLLCLAGPGSGKTRTLTARLAYLCRAGLARPEELLAVTFTRKAAAEIQARLHALIGPGAGGITIGTFHAIARQICLRGGRGGTLLSEGDRMALVARAAERARTDGRALYRALTLAKAEGLGVAHADPAIAAGLRHYEELRQALGASDLDDLLIDAVAVLRERPGPWRFILIDEYQDVNQVQRELSRALAAGSGDVFAIGDPDQAIYAFRGADVRHCFAFTEDFPGARVVHLGENFRSSATLVEAARAVIGRNQQPARVSQRPTRPAGAPITVMQSDSEAAEAERIAAEIERLIGGTSLTSYDTGRAAAWESPAYALSDIAVLSRTAARADALAQALLRAGVPIQRPRRSLWDTEEARDLLALLRLATPAGLDIAATLRVVACLARPALPALEQSLFGSPLGEGLPPPVQALLSALREELLALPPPERLARAAERLGTPEEITSAAQVRLGQGGEAALLAEDGTGHESDELDRRAERVSVLTLHGAKGLEFAVVFIAGCEAHLLPGEGATAEEIAEERRLFYVGLTRARDRLYLTWARRSRGTAAAPSPFLSELPESSTCAPTRPQRKRSGQMKLF